MNRASSEVNGFSELIQRFERNISIQGKSPRTFDNYSRHVAAIVRNIEGVKDSNLMDKLFSKNWVVYAKRPFGGPKQVIEYLGRYTHKVAISNHRIKEVTEREVRFGYKDYRKGGEKKEMTLSNVEFIRRFSLHILPKRFVRIRHYGILSSSWKRGKLQNLQSDLNIRIPEAKPKTLLNKCRCCKEGNLVTITIFGQRGPPQDFLFVTQPLSAK
ncbi:hypothetical protein NBC122_01986 [Chryseobacterium salivictor]|uniref:Transposase IS801/IS1294 domain-containing protein n=1 Tax=Chryseobacterium salivictor TaxID=2547600 RepID=A0A4V1AL76_9FLAO|nr:hypothetical protein NBC122_01986 [Chryseobacterium salivictor]